MRIIAGSAKGRVLAQPAGVTRPTSDRTREGIFSSLESEIGTCEGITFWDLFAGTGAVGLEALSRGALEVVAIEKDVKAANVCRQNYELIKNSVTGKFNLFRMGVEAFLDSEAATQKKCDVVYVDPPYEVSNQVIERILSALTSHTLLAPGAVVIVERSTRVVAFTWPAGFSPLKDRTYGEGTAYFAVFSEVSP